MCKYVLLVLILLLVALMAVAAVVVQEFGWVGFLILLGALVLFGFIVRKATPRLLAYPMTRPLRRMGAVLRGAQVTVHSVVPCDPPSSDEYDPDGYDDPEAIEDDEDPDGLDPDDEDDEPDGQFDWYELEFTIVPPDDGPSEGRIVTRQAWMPGLIGASGPRPRLDRANPFRGWPPPNQFTWNVTNVPAEVFTGSEYESVHESVFGRQRLRMRVGVTGAVRTVTITYAQFTDLGVVPLPRIDVSPGGGG